MPPKEFHYRWEFDLQGKPEELWPLVADTNRFNRDAGVPVVEPLSSTGGVRRLRLHKFGIPIDWEEQPFEWIRPFHFGVVRRYSKGPIREMRVQADLTESSEGGTRLVYQVWAKPRNVLGRIAIPIQISILSKRKFEQIFRRYDKRIERGEAPLYQPSPANFAQGGEARLKALSKRLIDQEASAEIVQLLSKLVAEADDLTLARIRSHALADYWGFPRRDVLEVCLMATRVGLLDLQWEMICPHCRGSARTSPSLTSLPSEVYCDSCEVDFAINFDRAVELTFRPNPSVRLVEVSQFCVGGPEVTPHIVFQQRLAPGAERQLSIPLEIGRYKFRTSEVAGEQYLQASAAGAAELKLRSSDEGWTTEELCITTQPSVTLENATDAEQWFVLERNAWSDQAATAAEVTALQVFRDLFANEALRPGQQIAVGTLTVLFTDLKGSTQLYREIGDAPAFGAVMSHFDVLRDAIAAEDGALVKTIGDAVMAVFRRPAGALRAFLNAQQTLASPPDGQRPLLLKVGIHSGPCIAVTLNGRLDYFGCTVNLAARLEGLSSGGDVVISGAVHSDHEVAEILFGPDAELTATPFEVTIKGFDEQQFELWRVAPSSTAVRGERAIRSNA